MLTFEEFCTEVKRVVPFEMQFVNIIAKTKKPRGETDLLYSANNKDKQLIIGYSDHPLPWVAVTVKVLNKQERQLTMYLAQSYINKHNLRRATLEEALEAGRL